MLELKKKAGIISQLTPDEQMEYLQREYPNLNDDIIKCFLIRHLRCGYVYDEFSFLKLKDCRVEERGLSIDEVFAINYSQFCTFRDESIDYFKGAKDLLENQCGQQGTWRKPILVTMVEGRMVAIDGNNRLRMLRCYLEHSEKYKAKTHSVYLLRQKDSIQTEYKDTLSDSLHRLRLALNCSI